VVSCALLLFCYIFGKPYCVRLFVIIITMTAQTPQRTNAEKRRHFCFNQGKAPDSSKITEANYNICLVANPTLAGRHQ